jgi:hypothetical protein
MALDRAFFQAPRAQAVVAYHIPRNRERLFRHVRYVVAVPPLLVGEFGAHAYLDDSLRVFDQVYLRWWPLNGRLELDGRWGPNR